MVDDPINYKNQLVDNPTHLRALLVEASISCQFEHKDKSLLKLKRLISISKGDSFILYHCNRLCESLSIQEYVKKTHLALLISDPSSDFFMINMGRDAFKNNRLDEAFYYFSRTIQLSSYQIESLYLMGKIHILRSQIDLAVLSWKKAIVSVPDSIDPLLNLMSPELKFSAKTKNIDILKRLIDLRQDLERAYCFLGQYYESSEEEEKAQIFYEKAICLKPDFFDPIFLLGNLLEHKNEKQKEFLWKNALHLDPNRGEAHCNYGILEKQQGLENQYPLSWKRSMILTPNYPPVYINIGNDYDEKSRPEISEKFFRKVIALDSEHIWGHVNLGMSLLKQGKFREGWQCYEWRWKIPFMQGQIVKFNVPEWKGEEGHGRTLYIFSEQGFGDCLNFSRYAELPKKRGWNVIFEVPFQLVHLMKCMKNIDLIVDKYDETTPPIDAYCSLHNLLLIYDVTLESEIPKPPYIFAEKAKIDFWDKKLKLRCGDCFKVGVVWAGDPRSNTPSAHEVDKRRSMPLDLLRPLLCDFPIDRAEKIKFFNLTKVYHIIPEDIPLINYMDEMKDFSDTAALVMNLDLVITVDTSMVHLVGALGKPVWMMDRFDNCWRWLENRDDSIWYPTLRIFRQKKPKDWPEVIERLKNSLISYPILYDERRQKIKTNTV